MKIIIWMMRVSWKEVSILLYLLICILTSNLKQYACTHLFGYFNRSKVHKLVACFSFFKEPNIISVKIKFVRARVKGRLEVPTDLGFPPVFFGPIWAFPCILVFERVDSCLYCRFTMLYHTCYYSGGLYHHTTSLSEKKKKIKYHCDTTRYRHSHTNKTLWHNKIKTL